MISIMAEILFDSGVKESYALYPTQTETEQDFLTRISKISNTVLQAYNTPITFSQETGTLGKSGYIQFGNVFIDITKTSRINFRVVPGNDLVPEAIEIPPKISNDSTAETTLN